MTKSNIETRSKITVRIHAPILDALNKRTDEACMRRDSLISRALEVELPRIQKELLHKNSDRARRFINAHLKVLFASVEQPKTISLALEPAVSELLEAVCDSINISRETLLNRLFLLLGGSAIFWDTHFFDFTPPQWANLGTEPEDDGAIEPNEYPIKDFVNVGRSWHTLDVKAIATQLTMLDQSNQDYDHALSPLGRISSIVADPLYWYRNMLNESAHHVIEKFYVQKGATAEIIECVRRNYTPFGIAFEDHELYGLNCIMEDEWLDDIQGIKKST